MTLARPLKSLLLCFLFISLGFGCQRKESPGDIDPHGSEESSAPVSDLAEQATPPIPPAISMADGAGDAEKKEVIVDPTGATGSITTLSDGFRAVQRILAEGIPARLTIKPGVYREKLPDLDWKASPLLRDTPLEISGEGEVIWSGADIFPAENWVDEGDALYSHEWPHRFGNYSPTWGPPHQLGHRREMVFVDGQPLRQVLLQKAEISGMGHWVKGTVRYGENQDLDPRTTLQPGTFGVIEGSGNQPGRIYVRVPGGLSGKTLEVAVRENLLNLVGKNNLTLRNLSFTKVASSLRGLESIGALRFGWREEDFSRNILIEDCRFSWGSGTGLRVAGDQWTIRNTTLNYNGFSGLTTGKIRNLVLRDTEASFNGWRAHWSGETSWFTGGLKIHQAEGNAVENHIGLGNLVAGVWYDIHCQNVRLRDVTLIDNLYGLMWELSQGPLLGERILIAGGKMGEGTALRLWNLGDIFLQDSIFYGNYGSGDPKPVLVELSATKRIESPEDEHARMAKIVPGKWEVSGSIFFGGSKMSHLIGVRDLRSQAIATANPIPYEGLGNLFFMESKTAQPASWFDPELRVRRPMSLEQWAEATREVRFFLATEPPLLDAAGYDFRPNPAIIAEADRKRLPSVRLSHEKQAEITDFFSWADYNPLSWSSSPTP